MLLSVIIPAYNVEDTLRRCVESVLNQDIDGMEVIIVDDGSTDGTPAICDEYGKREGITVVHQKNAGLSEARNTGIKIASGKLITFVDSDDYLAPATYQPLLDLLGDNPQYDILEFSMIKEDGEKVLKNLALPEKEYSDMAEYWVEGKAYAHTYAWNKIYRRHLFDEVRLPKGKKFEDVWTLPELLKEAKCVRTTSLGLYHYTYNSNGITVRADSKAWRDLLLAHIPLINEKKLWGYKSFPEYYYHVLNIQISTFESSGEEDDIMLPTLPYNQNWKLKLLHLLGMKRLCKLFYLTFHRFR